MSIINRIDDFFRLHKNKEVAASSGRRGLLCKSHERSFSVDTNQSTLQSLGDLLNEAYEMKRSKRFKEDSTLDSLRQFQEELEAQKGFNRLRDNSTKLVMKENEERKGLSLRNTRVKSKKDGHWRSSSLCHSSDDEGEEIKEKKTEKFRNQKMDQKPSQDRGLLEEKGEDKEAQMRKRALLGVRDLNEGIKGLSKKDREKDMNKYVAVDENLKMRGKQHLEFTDIVMVTSEILKPGVEEVEKQSSLEGSQVIGKSIEKKRSKYLSKTKGGSTFGKGSCPNFASEILKSFPLRQLRIAKNGDFDRRFRVVKDYFELCSLAKIDPMQYYQRNCPFEQRKIVEDLDQEQVQCDMKGIKQTVNPFLGDQGKFRCAKKNLKFHKERAFEVNPKKESKSFPFENIWIVPNPPHPLFSQIEIKTEEFLKSSQSFRETVLQHNDKNDVKEQQQILPRVEKANELPIIEESPAEATKPRVYRHIIKTDGITVVESLNWAKEELKRFPMEKLRITGKGFFDRRTRVTREFVSLCEEAMEDPLKYYNENSTKKREERWENLKKEKAKKDAEKALEKFPLNELRVISGGVFDTKVNITCEYLELCEKAGKDPLTFYMENYISKIEDAKENKEESKKEDGSEKRALEKLKSFPMEKLRVTLGGWFDRRFNISHEFMALCEKAKKDPMKYYEEHWIAKKKLLQKDPKAVGLALEKLKKFPLDDLRITQKGFFDRRFNLTHQYLDLCERANKDLIDYYNENIDDEEDSEEESERKELKELKRFPLEKLRITQKGRFDLRYNVTYEYLGLCERAKKDPMEYYKENRYKKQQDGEKKCCEKGMCDSCNAKASEVSKKEESNPALEELKRFPLEELRITQKGWFDRRFRVTKQFVSLCEKAGKDPMNYYRENLK